MSIPRLTLAAAFLAASPLAAQLEKVGSFATSFQNPTKSGSTNLLVQVHYPATAAGKNTPLKKTPGGWPVVVFLHGLGLRASLYTPCADYVAARGYVVVICDTGLRDTDVEATDGIALFHAVVSENARSNGFFHTALDTKRIGLAGHSMGGGNTVRVLASNPGYLAGAALAPWNHGRRDYAANYSAKVKVPLSIVHGQGDFVVGWQQGQRLYELATAYDRLKTLYVLNGDCNHQNLTGIGLTNATDRAVFDRTMSILVGFMDAYVKGQSRGLENVLGLLARAERRLVRLDHAIGDAELWMTGSAMLGKRFEMHALSKPGLAILLAGVRGTPIDTSLGRLVLQPATILPFNTAPASSQCLQTTPVPVPNNAALRGITVTFQAIARNTASTMQLTPGITAQIQ